MSTYPAGLEQLPAYRDDELNVIIEAPKGSHHKYAYDEEYRLFVLKGTMPAGAVFPFDFGFVPSTLGEDADPLDVLVLMDAPGAVGCLVPSRLIGVIEAEQTEEDGPERNDRLIAVAANSRRHSSMQTLEDASDDLLNEIEHFFVSYNMIKGKRFEAIGRHGPERAHLLVREGIERKIQKR
ncbi:inorganic diphosphatase [soil metagenome]